MRCGKKHFQDYGNVNKIHPHNEGVSPHKGTSYKVSSSIMHKPNKNLGADLTCVGIRLSGIMMQFGCFGFHGSAAE